MYERFGEFDSAEELNRKAAEQKAKGDREALVALAEENGIDREEAEDYMDGVNGELATPLMAAAGKLQAEANDLQLEGVLGDWKDAVMEMCMDDREMQCAVRRRGKCLRDCMAALIRFAFENKVQVSRKIVDAARETGNEKKESMKGPVYLGIPDRVQVRRIIREYYRAGESGENTPKQKRKRG